MRICDCLFLLNVYKLSVDKQMLIYYTVNEKAKDRRRRSVVSEFMFDPSFLVRERFDLQIISYRE